MQGSVTGRSVWVRPVLLCDSGHKTAFCSLAGTALATFPDDNVCRARIILGRHENFYRIIPEIGADLRMRSSGKYKMPQRP
jgi:hypothetical protein